MILSVKDGISKYSINYGPITQVCGQNIILKNYIIKSICKFFSNEKYADYEEKYVDNIEIDGSLPGRKQWECVKFSTVEDYILFLQVGKKSVLEKIIKEQLLEFDSQKELNEIDNLLLSIFGRINKSVLPEGNIELQYMQEELLSILTKATVKTNDGRDIHELSQYELVNEVVNMINNYQEKLPEKRLYVFENLDHILTSEQYCDIVSKCERLSTQSSAYFIFTTSMQRYLFISEESMENVNVINNEVFSFDGTEHLEKFINENYPVVINFSSEELLVLLCDVIQYVGMDKAVIPVESQAILKLLNDSIGITCKWQKVPKSPEIEFMIS